jgi:Niemann-Pick C1 protein
MNKIYKIIDDLKFSALVFPIAPEYANWETDEIIGTELFRNIGLSMACVFVTMLVLLADIWASILVMICVLMTLIDVMGYMHFWGITIDVMSSVVIIISIGLCVDYSAHIAHAFLTEKGNFKPNYCNSLRFAFSQKKSEKKFQKKISKKNFKKKFQKKIPKKNSKF